MPGDRLGSLTALRDAITACLDDVRLARDYDEPAAELDATQRLDDLLDHYPRGVTA